MDLGSPKRIGTHSFLGEECCYSRKESGVVETQVSKLQTLSLDLHHKMFSASADDWWRSSRFSLWKPLVGPLGSIFLCITLGPLIAGERAHWLPSEGIQWTPWRPSPHRSMTTGLTLLTKVLQNPQVMSLKGGAHGTHI